MDKEREFPQRKHPRLDFFDYSSEGAYFITICTQNRRCVLSRISEQIDSSSEDGIIEYSLYGKIAEQQLFSLELRYPFLEIDRYVIMPNHIHAILIIKETENAMRHPTIMDIVCAYKSLTTRECKKHGYNGKLFQTSFYEHIIRRNGDYREIANYIYENPFRWTDDELYAKD